MFVRLYRLCRLYVSSSSVSSVSSSSVSVSSAVSPVSYVSSLSSTPHISPIASVHPTSQSVGRIREPDRQPKPPTVGAVISDTGTETCIIWGKEVKTRLYDVQPLSEPVRLQVASGAHIYVHERAKMRVGKVVLEGYVMPDSPLSLISVDDLCVQG